ncbi:PP-loop family [Rhizoctonia solani]|uniref:tRNA(Ile)-lysidine synthetase n=1 Tax=Rhizoctonia solani TaxID=456999 RepID=A0A8H7HC89_9AGAM|nr:PP-loop family [Rhizoctonia solani]
MSAITLAEFTHLLSLSRPPTGWGKFITVALSGGPDSICLLSLLKRASLDVPLQSITIDHGLQPTSRDSALRTRTRSEAIGVPGVILPAEWNRGKPSPGEAVEEAARDARYQALWRGLQLYDGPGTVIFGHHADDQLETVIMRVLRGTGTYGLGGMRTVRRWGWVGIEDCGLLQTCTSESRADHALRGMQTYISRPLLTIPKVSPPHVIFYHIERFTLLIPTIKRPIERILATCRAYNLDYEQDVTNFMPDLTVRNAVRYALTGAHHSVFTNGIHTPNLAKRTLNSLPIVGVLNSSHVDRIARDDTVDGVRDSISIDRIQAAISHVHTLAGGTGEPNLDLMRAYVGKMSVRVRQVDGIGVYNSKALLGIDDSTLFLVTNYLQTYTRPSPPSTLLLVPPPKQQIETDVTHALIHRILRYTSPHPWGAPESEAHRRKTSIERIAHRIFDETEQPASFCAGAQVLWSPVWVRKDGSIRTRRAGDEHGGRTKAWLASRQPPSALTSLDRQVGPGETLVVWDNRFLIRVPDSGICIHSRLVVRPRGRFVLPHLVRNDHAVDNCGVEFVRELGAI